jgi:hypothetical protein
MLDNSICPPPAFAGLCAGAKSGEFPRGFSPAYAVCPKGTEVDKTFISMAIKSSDNFHYNKKLQPFALRLRKA